MSGMQTETVAGWKIKYAALELKHATLQEKYDLLKDELAQTRLDSKKIASFVSMQEAVPLEFTFTNKERKLFALLYSNPGHIYPKFAILDELYRIPDFQGASRTEDEIPEPKIVDVFVCKINKKTRPHGIEISNVWGQGYTMTRENFLKVEKMLEANRGAYVVNESTNVE